MVGVNAHVEADEEEPGIHRADPAVERRQIERVRAWRDRREAADHAAALGALRSACEGDENVMPDLVAAARAGATIGELCDVLREVWGAYRDPARW
jgi:methylmalonyl-CoA mutase N-terminal domain/subunit